MAEPESIPIALVAAFAPIANLIVILRFCARHTLRRQWGVKLGWDDFLILPALFFADGQAAILIANAYVGGLGKHQPLDSEGYIILTPQLKRFQQLEYVSFLTFVLALLFTKLSLLHLYFRFIGKKTNRKMHYMHISIQIWYGLNVLWGIAFFFGFIFKCSPVWDYWETANERGNCLPNSFNYSFAISNAILDAGILALPFPIIWSLQLSQRGKWALRGILSLGGIVVGVAIVKAVAFYHTLQPVEFDHDIAFNEAPLFYYAVPEALVAVTCACLPTLKPLFVKPAPLMESLRSPTRTISTARGSTANTPVAIELSNIPAAYRGRRRAGSDIEAPGPYLNKIDDLETGWQPRHLPFVLGNPPNTW